MPRSAQCTHVRCNFELLGVAMLQRVELWAATGALEVACELESRRHALCNQSDRLSRILWDALCTDDTVRRGFGAYLLVLRVLFGQCVQGTLSTLARGCVTH